MAQKVEKQGVDTTMIYRIAKDHKASEYCIISLHLAFSLATYAELYYTVCVLWHSISIMILPT